MQPETVSPSPSPPSLPGAAQLKAFFKSNSKLEVADAALVTMSGTIFALETVESVASNLLFDLVLRFTEDAIVVFFAGEVWSCPSPPPLG